MTLREIREECSVLLPGGSDSTPRPPALLADMDEAMMGAIAPCLVAPAPPRGAVWVAVADGAWRPGQLAMVPRARTLRAAGYPTLLMDFQATGESAE